MSRPFYGFTTPKANQIRKKTLYPCERCSILLTRKRRYCPACSDDARLENLRVNRQRPRMGGDLHE